MISTVMVYYILRHIFYPDFVEKQFNIILIGDYGDYRSRSELNSLRFDKIENYA